MPQMAPMPWTSLYIFFLVVLFVIFSILYFSPLVSGTSAVVKKSSGVSYLWQW